MAGSRRRAVDAVERHINYICICNLVGLRRVQNGAAVGAGAATGQQHASGVMATEHALHASKAHYNLSHYTAGPRVALTVRVPPPPQR